MSIFSNNTNRYLMTDGHILTESISFDAIYDVMEILADDLSLCAFAGDTIEAAYKYIREKKYMKDILLMYALLGELQIIYVLLNAPQAWSKDRCACTFRDFIIPMFEERKAEINKILNEYCFE